MIAGYYWLQIYCLCPLQLSVAGDVLTSGRVDRNRKTLLVVHVGGTELFTEKAIRKTDRERIMPTFSKGSKSVLYLHVPKTGGTYVEQLLIKNGFSMHHWSSKRVVGSIKRAERAPLQHMHSAMILSLFDPSKFSFVFATVREPISRLISEFRMRNPQEACQKVALKWMREAIEKCRSDPFIYENHIRSQADFLVEGTSVFKQENGFGSNFVSDLESSIGVKFKVQSTKRHMEVKSELTEIQIRSCMSQHDIRELSQFYERDYEVFKYQWPL